MYNPMQPPAPRTLHPVLPVTVLPAVYMLERFTYYGVRSILLLYMMKTMLFGHEVAMNIYSLFTIVLFMMAIPAGIFNDFVLRPRLGMVIGIGAEILGCFLLAVPSVITMAGGMLLLIIGTSLFKTAMMALMGSYYINTGRSNLLDSGYAVLYVGINIGAFLAPAVIGGLSDDGNPGHLYYGFLIAAFAGIIALVLLLVFYKQIAVPTYTAPAAPQLPYMQPIPKTNHADILSLVAVLLLLPVFWQAYEIMSNPFYISESFSQQSGFIPGIAAVCSCGLGVLLWTFMRIDSRIKIAAGMLLAVLLMILAMAVPENQGVAIVLIILAAVAEMFVTVAAASVTAFNAPASWRATFFGLSYFLAGGFGWAVNKLHIKSGSAGIDYFSLFILLLSIVFAVFFLVYALVNRRKPYSS